jgi:hypothetical protein
MPSSVAFEQLVLRASTGGAQFLVMLLETAFTIHAMHLRFSQQRLHGMNAILYAKRKPHRGSHVQPGEAQV